MEASDPRGRTLASRSSPAVYRAARQRRLWYSAILAALGLYAGLPWLAPVFMKLGWEPPGRILYMAYSTQCHQLANRSYFLFGPEWMVPPDRLAAAGAETSMLGLRAFLGSSEIGWKVAWSDRMVAMYSSAFLFLLIAPISRRLRRPLSVGVFLLMTLPLALDGTTHFLSDLQGFGQGFRDSNAWLVTLTNGGLPASFYAGDAWGSFNATARLVTGILFGVGAAWTLVPRLLPDVELMIRSGAVGATPATRTEGGTTRTEPIHPTIVTPGPSARPAAVQHRVQGGTHGD